MTNFQVEHDVTAGTTLRKADGRDALACASKDCGKKLGWSEQERVTIAVPIETADRAEVLRARFRALLDAEDATGVDQR